jgi:hypothetical protein
MACGFTYHSRLSPKNHQNITCPVKVCRTDDKKLAAGGGDLIL